MSILAGASLLVGFLLGFLFGVPRRQKDQRTLEPGPLPPNFQDRRSTYRGYEPNTNLEEISDWLTKIIVGIGLANLSRVGPQFAEATSAISLDLGFSPGSGGQVIVGATSVYFVCVGLLFGYLFAQINLFDMLAERDRKYRASLADKASSIQELEPRNRPGGILARRATRDDADLAKAATDLARVEAQSAALGLGAGLGTLECLLLAKKRITEGDFRGALEVSQAAIFDNPNFLPLYLEKGRALHRLGRTHEALESVEQGLKIARGPAAGSVESKLLYNRACYRTKLASNLAEDKQAILADLEQAFRLLPLLSHAAGTDPDLEALWQDPDFVALVDRCK